MTGKLDLLLILGVVLGAGLFGAKSFKRAKIPKVVGYIVIGLILGESVLGILHFNLLDQLAPINDFALGVIGFMIGGELDFSVFQKMGKSIFTILFVEVFITFGMVGLAVWFLTGKLHTALIFGALATATAPAATVDVLWEFHSQGELSSTILAIVGLDDALALIVFGFAAAYARVLIGYGSFSLAAVLLNPLVEIGGSIALGIAVGIGVGKIAKRARDDKEFLTLMLGVILISCGIAQHLHLSQILVCMFVGMTLTNRYHRYSERAVRLLDISISPIYILFFVMIGAKLQVGLLPKMGLLGLAYIGARSTGKILGAYVGARVSHAADVVRKYLGPALFSQAGVAVGLSIAVAHDFSNLNAAGKELGTLVINVIAATTFIVQIIGPPCVKYSITKAGEVGKAKF